MEGRAQSSGRIVDQKRRRGKHCAGGAPWPACDDSNAGGAPDGQKRGWYSRLRDLSPLKKLILLFRRLNVSYGAVDDLNSLKSLALHELDISNTLVDELAPLKRAAAEEPHLCLYRPSRRSRL